MMKKMSVRPDVVCARNDYRRVRCACGCTALLVPMARLFTRFACAGCGRQFAAAEVVAAVAAPATAGLFGLVVDDRLGI